jgi:hypothetical protein
MGMTFEEKFISCLQNFEDQSFPNYTRNELFLFADFVELVTLFSKNGVVSMGDIQDRFFGTEDYDSASKRDNDEAFIIEVFLKIEERNLLFRDTYPYSYDDQNMLLIIKSTLTDVHKLYINLLISSKLNIFKEFRSELTTEFEYICKSVLENFLPSHAIVKNFGRNTAYDGNAKNKIRQLASDLNLKVDEYEISCVSERNNQERGLDIVGWIPFEDKCMNLLVFLAQCACGKQYESKQHDTRRFTNYLDFYKSNPIHVLFIPYSLININEKKFYHSDLIEKDYLVFERKRIIELFNLTNYSSFVSYNIVNNCIAYKENIV